MMVGKVYPAGAMFSYAFSASGHSAPQYVLSTSIQNTPEIKSVKTGKLWTIGWNELLELAIAAGVDEESESNDAA